MRDPDGSIRFEDACVVRTLRRPLDESHFLRSSLAEAWRETGELVAYEIHDAYEISAARLPFLSHPHEWSDAQLFSAARLTLKLQKEATASGFDLKDASAWNVVFDGTRPVFCDLLSFVALRSRPWVALGQYSRQFLLPLLLSRRRGLRAHQSFHLWRDGVPAETGRQLLGPTRFLTRYWPLLAGSAKAIAPVSASTEPNSDIAALARFRASIHASLDWWLEGVDPSRARLHKSMWERYAHERGHYDAAAVVCKQSQVAQWLALTRPEWVLDLGCNTGEFAKIALKSGAKVVAIDADHDSVQQLFSSAGSNPDLFPVVASLDDMKGGSGWLGVENPGLMPRLEQRFDLVLMLALIHHLSVAASIPLESVAAMARRCTRQWLIVEFIDPVDPQMELLCRQRQRNAADFSIQAQRDAFSRAGFELQAEVGLDPTRRSLALLKKCR